jgi:hypothetical protein
VNGQTYYNLDGSADWLKTIVRTVHVYTEDRGVVVTDLPTMAEISHKEIVVFVETIAAHRAQNLYFRKTAYLEVK